MHFDYYVLRKQAPPWSAAAWRRFGFDHTPSITKRRQAAALQGWIDDAATSIIAVKQRSWLQQFAS